VSYPKQPGQDAQAHADLAARHILAHREIASLRAKLAEAERDAGRWRAVRPELEAHNEWFRDSYYASLYVTNGDALKSEDQLTVEQIVDALAQREKP